VIQGFYFAEPQMVLFQKNFGRCTFIAPCTPLLLYSGNLNCGVGAPLPTSSTISSEPINYVFDIIPGSDEIRRNSPVIPYH
jgi:hypothetical protein